MLTTADTQRLLTGGATLVADDGQPLGRVDDVFLDGTTGRPAWAAVTVGRLRKHTAYVPLADATRDGDAFRVPVTHDAVAHAPRIDDVEGRLDPQAELELSRHYGLVPAADDAGPVDAGPTTVDPLRRHPDVDGVPADAPPTVLPPPPPGELVDAFGPSEPAATPAPAHHPTTSDQPGTSPEAGERR